MSVEMFFDQIIGNVCQKQNTNREPTDASIVVSSLSSGLIVVSHSGFPVGLVTDSGSVFPIEKGTITISSGAWVIDPAAYLAYAGESSFTGPWTIYFTGNDVSS